MYRVEGKTHLVKDPKTGSVINVDDSSFRKARENKKRILAERKRAKELEQRVEKLEAALELLLKEKENG